MTNIMSLNFTFKYMKIQYDQYKLSLGKWHVSANLQSVDAYTFMQKNSPLLQSFSLKHLALLAIHFY